MAQGGSILLLSDFARPARRSQVATGGAMPCTSCEPSADGRTLPEPGCVQLQAWSLPWRGWRDRAQGTVGGEAEATFETLRALMAFDGDLLKVCARAQT
jgi:hypothetical protein